MRLSTAADKLPIARSRASRDFAAWKGPTMSATMVGGGAGGLQPEAGRMGSSWRDQWFNHPRHGPLPALLLVLTVATGVVDAVSILVLGRVFIANMTGNVVFIGFALAGAPGFSLIASLLAMAGFLLGAAAGARWSPGSGSPGGGCWPW